MALDNAGRVTVDKTVRTYSGVRLPGPGADAATLRATSSGELHLAGGLTVDGSVGIGTANPGHDLEIGAYQGQDRFLTFKVEGGNTHMSGVNMWAWQDNYGYSLRYDERMASPNGLHIKSHNLDPVGATRMFLDWFTGNVGIGTTTPGARLRGDRRWRYVDRLHRQRQDAVEQQRRRAVGELGPVRRRVRLQHRFLEQ